ncbi:amidohydrolase family protein [Echinicola sediminis]
MTGAYAITNATIIPQPGKLEKNATIIIRDGLIQSVGKGLDIPKDAIEIKGDSLFIYAGFIDAMGFQGVSAPPKIEQPENMDPSDPPNNVAGITPERDVLDYWDLKHKELEKWRNVGFTMAQIMPKGEMLPGKSAVVILGSGNSSNIISRSTGLFAQFETPRNLYPGTVLGIMAKWRDLYKNAELGAAHDQLFVSTANGVIRPESNLTLEALYPVIKGDIPVVFRTKDELEIRRALKLQNELGFKLVLAGVESGSSLSDDISLSDAKVILALELPEDKAFKKEMKDAGKEAQMAHQRVKEAYDTRLAEASQFEKADIPFAFGTAGAKHDDFFKNVRLMLEKGLSEEAALAALTTHPAQLLGIERFTGSLEKGKLANWIATTDTLFKEGTAVKYVMADGYLFEYDVDRSKNVKEAYKKVLGSWKYVSETPGGTSDGTMDFSESSGDLSGEIVVDDPDGSGETTLDLEDIHFDGTKLSFSFHIMVKGEKLLVNIKGTVEGDKFEGTLNIKDMGSYSFKATKEPQVKF